jgi:hypothetical protein
MAINFRTFGSKNPVSAAASDERAKAQFWANIGYVSNVKDDSGEYRFVSLGLGIPLDGIETLPTDMRNTQFAQFNQARNQLRDDLIEDASKLAPGEDTLIPIGDTGLMLQIRRVAEKVELPNDGSNPFLRAKAG